MTSTRTSSIRLVRALIDAVEAAGVSRQALLETTLDPTCLEVADKRVPLATLHRLCDVALTLTQDPALGLHALDRASWRAFDPLADLALHAANLEEALRALCEFGRLLYDGPLLSFEIHGSEATVQHSALASGDARLQRFLAEITVGSLFRLVRTFCPHATPQSISFEYAPPEYEAEYQRTFDGLARFGQPFTGLCLSTAQLSAASPYHDPCLYTTLRRFATQSCLLLGGSVTTMQLVRSMVEATARPRRLPLQSVAAELGISERTLRRRLHAEGYTYASLLGESLLAVARRCLIDERRSIHDTALTVGFDNKAAFHRAFKRWTGMTPSAFRLRQLDWQSSAELAPSPAELAPSPTAP